jgi:TfoX/Sxy family transcriptional regulator of competence genes
MSWKQSSDSKIELFERMVPVDRRVERRTMFGGQTGFANGNLFLGLHENRLFIRLSEDDRAVLIKEFKAKAFEPMPARKSRDTLVVPDRIAADPARLRSWCERALSHALSLPRKVEKTVAKVTKAKNATYARKATT